MYTCLDRVAEGYVNTECLKCPNLGNFHTISHSDAEEQNFAALKQNDFFSSNKNI